MGERSINTADKGLGNIWKNKNGCYFRGGKKRGGRKVQEDRAEIGAGCRKINLGIAKMKISRRGKSVKDTTERELLRNGRGEVNGLQKSRRREWIMHRVGEGDTGRNVGKLSGRMVSSTTVSNRQDGRD